MKSQAIIISAFLSAVLITAAILVLFTYIYSYSSVVYIKTRNVDVYSIVYSRPIWDARELAIVIAEQLDASYVSVNITTVNIVDNTVVSTDYYILEPVGKTNLIYYTYHFSRLSSNGVLYIYSIKVGIK